MGTNQTLGKDIKPAEVPAAKREVSVQLEVPPEPDEWERLQAEFEEKTGFRLEAK